MFPNDWMQQRLAQEHRRELLQQADQERLVRRITAEPNGPILSTYRMRDWLGRQLVVAGQRLQSNHKAATTTAVLRASHRSR